VSFSTTVTVAVPVALASGTKLSAPAASMVGAATNSAAFVVVTVNANHCHSSSSGPAKTGMRCGPRTCWDRR